MKTYFWDYEINTITHFEYDGDVDMKVGEIFEQIVEYRQLSYEVKRICKVFINNKLCKAIYVHCFNDIDIS